MFARLGRFCVRRPKTILTAWLLLVACLLAAAAAAGRVTSESVSIPGSDSQAARDVAATAFPSTAFGSEPLVLTVKQGSLTDPGTGAAVRKAADAIRRVPHVTGVTVPYDAGKAQLAPDGRTGYLAITLDVSGRDVTSGLTHEIATAAQPAVDHGVQVTPGGHLASAVSKPSTGHSDLIGLAAAAVILLVGLGTAVAAGIPLLIAVTGVAGSLAAIGLIGHLMDMPSSGETIATMIGLGVGVDYTLFCLTRYRALRAGGSSVEDAVVRTTASSGKAVCFAGCAVITALASLALGGLSLLHALALAPAIAVLMAMASSVTLLPALLALLGPRIERLSIRRRGAGAGLAQHARGWARVAAHVTARPWRYLAGSLLLLALLAVPAAQLTFGQLDAGSNAKGSVARNSYDQLAGAFGPGSNGPLLITDTLPTPAAGVNDPRITAVTHALATTAGVAGVGPAQIAGDGIHVRWQVTPGTAPSDPATASLVRELRAETLPQSTTGSGQVAHVGGTPAIQADLNQRLADRLPAIIGAVVAISALLLLLAFRSPVLAVKAAAMNLVSVAAAYGVLTAVFQWGWGARWIGLEGAVPIEGYIPLVMFAVLFGLSMDYEVFLLSAVREAYLVDGDNRRAVATGLAGTGRVISSASTIMVCVFLSFLLVSDPVVKMFGVGLAAAIALDATVVRGLLVPATMVLLGRVNWWIPAWLDRLLPRVDIEGDARHARAHQPSAAMPTRTDEMKVKTV